MPGRFFGRKRGNRLGTIINSEKNSVGFLEGITAATNLIRTVATAVNAADNTVQNQVTRDCKIFKIWVEFWIYGLSASETNDLVDVYLFKNPGNNLTPPNPGTIGTSNEKKFVFREWRGLLARKDAGGMPYQFKGWIKVPRVYQRMGTDDNISLVVRSPTTGNICMKFIYKWFK